MVVVDLDVIATAIIKLNVRDSHVAGQPLHLNDVSRRIVTTVIGVVASFIHAARWPKSYPRKNDTTAR